MAQRTVGKHIKQINNLEIKYTDKHKYFVFTPDRICLKYGMTLEEAELYCARCKDYLRE